jgi:type IV secretion system protein VirB4
MGMLSGAVPWAKKEAPAGERLPYLALCRRERRAAARWLGDAVAAGPGLNFETADTDELNAHAATREVLLRSALDARFVMYHHVVRRRVNVELQAGFRRSAGGAYRRPLARTAGQRRAVRQRPVRHPGAPPCARQGRLGRAARPHDEAARKRTVEADPTELRALKPRRRDALASLGAYGARLLGDYEGGPAVLGSARAALGALQWRDAPGAPSRRRHRSRPDAALQAAQLRARRAGTARRW